MANKRRRVRRRSIDAARSSTPTPEPADAERSGATDNNTVTDTVKAFDFECVLCGEVKGRADISTRPRTLGEWVISCWSCSQGSYLFDLADAIGVPGGGYALKEDPLRYLAPYITRRVARASEPAPLPSSEDIRAWCRMLRRDPDVMRYLLGERGLGKRVVERARLGYDGRAITIPIYDVRTRELVNLRYPSVRTEPLQESVWLLRDPGPRAGGARPSLPGTNGRLTSACKGRLHQRSAVACRARVSRTALATSASCSAVLTIADMDTPSVRARLVILLQVGLRRPRSMPLRYVGCMSASSASASIVRF